MVNYYPTEVDIGSILLRCGIFFYFFLRRAELWLCHFYFELDQGIGLFDSVIM